MAVCRAIVVLMSAQAGQLPDIAHLLTVADGPRASKAAISRRGP
ncbi:hypothetical protein [Nonomuraea sp. NEAU-A123]|nr:hypothetical protein [Nonomuraea sp. NEAU-A123]